LETNDARHGYISCIINCDCWILFTPGLSSVWCFRAGSKEKTSHFVFVCDIRRLLKLVLLC
jgi:hypothetical protein